MIVVLAMYLGMIATNKSHLQCPKAAYDSPHGGYHYDDYLDSNLDGYQRYLEATTIATHNALKPPMLTATMTTRDALKPSMIGAHACTIIVIHKGSGCFNGLDSFLVA